MVWFNIKGLFVQLILSAHFSFFTEKGVQPNKSKEFFMEKS